LIGPSPKSRGKSRGVAGYPGRDLCHDDASKIATAVCLQIDGSAIIVESGEEPSPRRKAPLATVPQALHHFES